MQGWTKYKLKAVVVYVNGGAWPATSYDETGIPVVRVSDVDKGRVNLDDCKYLNEKFRDKYVKHKLEIDDLIVCTVGSHPDKQTSVVGGIARVSNEIAGSYLNQNAVLLRSLDTNLLDQVWLYYFAKSHAFKSHIESEARGSANQVRIAIGNLLNLEFLLPPLEEQKAIASILSALDDKIELNLQMNKTLEEMAMALYKHWFVDFVPFQNGNFIESELGMIPEGWEVKLFSKLYELKKGLSYKSKFYSEDGLPMINLKCFDRNGGFREDGIKYYAGDFKQNNVVKPGDLMIAMTDLTQDRAVLGSPVICPEIKSGTDVIASLDIGILKQNDVYAENLNLYFNYKMRTKTYHEYILGYGNGSTVMHLDKKGVLEYSSIIPSPNVILDFNNVVGKYRDQMMTNIHEIKTLTTLRDTLLPKLISGEVRVKDAEQLLAAAL